MNIFQRLINTSYNEREKDSSLQEKYLNILYDASLEFGPNWMCPLNELAKERPELTEDESSNLCSYIEQVRNDINKYIDDKYDQKIQNTVISESEIKKWIKEEYPWMHSKNISHGFSQGMYYAWHG